MTMATSLAGSRAEGHPQANLARPARDGKRQQAVDANAGEQERDRRKAREHANLDSPCRRFRSTIVGQQANVRDRLLRVGARDDLADGRQPAWLSGRSALMTRSLGA